MTNIYNVKVNPNKSHLVDTGYTFSQGDFGITLAITVEELDTTGTTVKIGFRKKSGSVEATTLTAYGNTYSYVLRGTELDTPGEVIADVKFYNASSQRISTASFKFMVAEDVLAGLPEEAHSWSDSLEQMRGKMVDEVLRDITTKPMKFRGGISSTGQLPMTGNANGDFYILTTNNHTYAWNGSTWTDIGVIAGIDQVATEALDIKMLGWSVPKECPVQNYMDTERKFHQRVVRHIFSGTETVVAWGPSYPHLFRIGVNFGQKTSEESQIYMNGYVPYRSVMSYAVNNVYTASNGDICINDISCTTSEQLKQAIAGKCIYIVAENEVTIPVDGNEAIGKTMYLEFQSITTTGLFDGNAKESMVTVPDLHPGYKRTLINVTPATYSVNNYVRAFGEINSNGTVYIEHNLNNNPYITLSVLYVKQ